MLRRLKTHVFRTGFWNTVVRSPQGPLKMGGSLQWIPSGETNIARRQEFFTPSTPGDDRNILNRFTGSRSSRSSTTVEESRQPVWTMLVPGLTSSDGFCQWMPSSDSA